MCTFENDRTVEVCDVAIGAVRKALEEQFFGSVTFAHRDGAPTLVSAAPGIPAAHFRSTAERVIAAVQLTDRG